MAAAPSLASQRIISAKERGENADALLDHHIAGESTLEKSEHIITVDHLTKEFKLPRKKEMFKAVDDVSFSVKRGTTLAIVGESGSGKSTVANMVLHLLKPTSGKVFYEGRDTSTFKAKDLLRFPPPRSAGVPEPLRFARPDVLHLPFHRGAAAHPQDRRFQVASQPCQGTGWTWSRCRLP